MANLERQLALTRSAPIAMMHQRNSVQAQTCAERGYGYLRHDPDDCWVWNQKWLREENGEQELELWRVSQVLTWAAFDARHSWPVGTAMEWSGCLCPEGSPVSMTPRFTEQYCGALIASYGQGEAAASIAAAHPQTVAAPAQAVVDPEEHLGSLVPDNEHVCYQGTMANLERQLALTRSAPIAMMHQRNSVQAQTCAERGYGYLRHDPDDCWVWNQKWLREENGDQELELWRVSQVLTWAAFDARHSWPVGTAMDWSACLCPEGSPVSTPPRFTEQYCGALIASYNQGEAAASISAVQPQALL